MVKLRLPQQRVRYGKAGYIGDVETYNPAAPQPESRRVVTTHVTEDEPPAEAKPRKTTRKSAKQDEEEA
jgi:hypothetical protein